MIIKGYHNGTLLTSIFDGNSDSNTYTCYPHGTRHCTNVSLSTALNCIYGIMLIWNVLSYFFFAGSANSTLKWPSACEFHIICDILFDFSRKQALLSYYFVSSTYWFTTELIYLVRLVAVTVVMVPRLYLVKIYYCLRSMQDPEMQ